MTKPYASTNICRYFEGCLELDNKDFVRLMSKAGVMALDLYSEGWFNKFVVGVSDVATASFSDAEVEDLLKLISTTRTFAIKVGRAHDDGRKDEAVSDDYLRLCHLMVGVAKMVGDGLVTFRDAGNVNDQFDDLDALRFGMIHELDKKIVVGVAGNALPTKEKSPVVQDRAFQITTSEASKF